MGTLLLAGAAVVLLRRQKRRNRSFLGKKRPGSGGTAELAVPLLGVGSGSSVSLLNPLAPSAPMPAPMPAPDPAPPAPAPAPVAPAPDATQPLAFTQEQLEAATGGFADGTMLDEGAFGAVYRGSIDGRAVAIKVLKPEAAAMVVAKGAEQWSGAGGFHKELQVLGKIRHPNIVALLGFCLDDAAGDSGTSSGSSSGSGSGSRLWRPRGKTAAAPVLPKARQCLVFEFMAGGSLRGRLAASSSPPPSLSCEERFSVASDVARGLEFLHVQANPPIIHQDVKSDNILLCEVGGGRLLAKLGDFGTARFAPQLLRKGAHGSLHTHHSTVHVVGTKPYMAGEYLQLGHVSQKTDTYAFGVVLLELLTGRPPHDEDSGELLAFAVARQLAHAERHLPALLDARPGSDEGAWPLPRALALARIANRCIAPMALHRCVVADVLPELNLLAGRGAAPRTRSSSFAALAARQEAASLVGRHIDVEGRGEGVVTAVQAALGKPTHHLVEFADDRAAGPQPVLLQKQVGGNGAKFFLMLPAAETEGSA